MTTKLEAAGSILALGEMLRDGNFLKELREIRDQAIAEQKNLDDLSEKSRTLSRERKQFEADRAAHAKQLATDQAALDKRRADLERAERLHSESASILAADRAAFDSQHKEFMRFKNAVGQ